MKRFKLNFRAGFFIFFLIFLGNFKAVAAPENKVAKKSQKKAEAPTRIRSDIIDIKRKTQVIDFINNVVVEKEDSSLLAEKMTVIYYDDKDGEGESKIKRIDAKENVKIFTDEFIGSGDSGYFEPDKNIFVLEKNVVINNGASIASGDKFIYDLTTKKGNFVGKKEETVGGKTNSQDPTDRRVVVVIGDDIKEQKKSKKSQEKNEQQNP